MVERELWEGGSSWLSMFFTIGTDSFELSWGVLGKSFCIRSSSCASSASPHTRLVSSSFCMETVESLRLGIFRVSLKLLLFESIL